MKALQHNKMNKEYFITLFEYDRWANQQIIDALNKYITPPEKSKSLLLHIGAALDFWFVRVTSETPIFNSLFQETDFENGSKLVLKASERWIEYLNKDEVDLDTVIHYKTTKGMDFSNLLYVIITQLLTHGPYHRGQINQVLRQNELEPVITDYIYFMRK